MPYIAADGIDIHYVQRERGAKLNLLLLHGSGGSCESWPKQVLELAEANVFAVDLPGHGASGGQGQVTVSAYAASVKSIIAALEIDRVVLCGHSLGGAIALQLALERPPWLSRLILVGTGARLRVAPTILQALDSDFEGAMQQMNSFLLGPGASEEVRATVTEASIAPATARVMQGDLTACDRFDVLNELDKIDAPTLIIAGTCDKLTPPKYSTYLRDHIRGATLFEIQGAGHVMTLEQPEAFCRALSEFLPA